MENNKIYIHKNKSNGKVYVGQTKRKTSHRWGPDGKDYLGKRNGKYKQSKFANAINKYGWDGFEHIVLYEDLTSDEADKKEIELIEEYNSVSNGYNSEYGGKSQKEMSVITRNKISANMTGENNHRYGEEVSQETRDRISKANKGRTLTTKQCIALSERMKGEKNPNYGKKTGGGWQYLSEEQQEKFKYARKGLSSSRKGYKFTDEERKAASERVSGEKNPMYGKHLSEEHKRKLSEANKGKQCGEKNPNYGKPMSDNRKQKISKAMKGRKPSEKTLKAHRKKVRNVDTGEEFNSIKDANISCGAPNQSSSIQAQIKGKTKTALGYRWEYIK